MKFIPGELYKTKFFVNLYSINAPNNLLTTVRVGEIIMFLEDYVDMTYKTKEKKFLFKDIICSCSDSVKYSPSEYFEPIIVDEGNI